MSVTLIEVGPRDGLQSEAMILTPAQRIALCDRLAQCGLHHVEATSFVRADRVPTMHSAEEVMRGLRRDLGTSWSALVLNERGYDAALSAGAHNVNYTMPMTDAFGARNQRTTVDAAAAVGESLLGRAASDGVALSIGVSGRSVVVARMGCWAVWAARAL
jgi:isopropylmalate/homocitrate/citramalate synthase